MRVQTLDTRSSDFVFLKDRENNPLMFLSCGADLTRESKRQDFTGTYSSDDGSMRLQCDEGMCTMTECPKNSRGYCAFTGGVFRPFDRQKHGMDVFSSMQDSR